MLASAAAFTLPPVIDPPMMITSFTRGTMEGSFAMARAMLVRRPHRDQRDLVRRGVDHLDDEVWAKMRIHFALAGRQFDIRQTILAMPELSRDELLEERMLRSGSDGNIAPVGERYHAQRILQPLTGRDVSRDNSDGAHVEFRRIERQHQGQRVVRSGIGIENDFLAAAEAGTAAHSQIRSKNETGRARK